MLGLAPNIPGVKEPVAAVAVLLLALLLKMLGVLELAVAAAGLPPKMLPLGAEGAALALVDPNLIGVEPLAGLPKRLTPNGDGLAGLD